MSITLEFYSASSDVFLQEVEKWFKAEIDEASALQADHLYTRYPHADFSFHLRWPEDIDIFCQILLSEGLDMPEDSSLLLMKEIWSDSVSVWIDLISPDFSLTMANISDDMTTSILEKWARYFIPSEATRTTQHIHVYNNIAKAFSDLRLVSQDVVQYNKDLILFRVW